MSKDVELGLVRVQGRDLMAHANTDGRWRLTEPPEEGEEMPAYARALGSGESLDEAKRAARKALKKQEIKVSVPFKWARMVGSFGSPKELVIEEGIADALKAGDPSTVLVTVKGNRDTVTRSYSREGKIWRPDTDDEKIAEYRRLQEESRAIAKKADEIEEEWGLELSSAVRDAIDEEAEISEEQEPEDIVASDEVRPS